MKSGEMDRKLGRKLNDGIRLRNKARYDSHGEIGEKEAQEMIRLATTLIDQLNRKLS